MTYENFIKAKLLDFAIQEAWHEHAPASVLAVAKVIRNRITVGWYGGDWWAAIEDAPKRSPRLNMKPIVNPREILFRQMLGDIDGVFNGSTDFTDINPPGLNNEPHTALYYCELPRVESAWFKENILGRLDDHPIIAKVGAMTFLG